MTPVPHADSPFSMGQAPASHWAKRSFLFWVRLKRVTRIAWRNRARWRLQKSQNRDLLRQLREAWDQRDELRRQLHEAWGLKERG